MRYTAKSFFACAAFTLLAGVAWADGNNNVCRPDPNSAETADTVFCSWPSDPSANPLPDITNCQSMLRVPTSSSDDCGNSDFKSCMENLGFECAESRN